MKRLFVLLLSSLCVTPMLGSIGGAEGIALHSGVDIEVRPHFPFCHATDNSYPTVEFNLQVGDQCLIQEMKSGLNTTCGVSSGSAVTVDVHRQEGFSYPRLHAVSQGDAEGRCLLIPDQPAGTGSLRYYWSAHVS